MFVDSGNALTSECSFRCSEAIKVIVDAPDSSSSIAKAFVVGEGFVGFLEFLLKLNGIHEEFLPDRGMFDKWM